MSELDQDWIQRDLDAGAGGDDLEEPLDLISVLRFGPLPAAVAFGLDD